MILFCFYDDIFEQLFLFFLMFYCFWVFLLSRRPRLGPFEHDMGYESSTYFYDRRCWDWDWVATLKLWPNSYGNYE